MMNFENFVKPKQEYIDIPVKKLDTHGKWGDHHSMSKVYLRYNLIEHTCAFHYIRKGVMILNKMSPKKYSIMRGYLENNCPIEGDVKITLKTIFIKGRRAPSIEIVINGIDLQNELMHNQFIKTLDSFTENFINICSDIIHKKNDYL